MSLEDLPVERIVDILDNLNVNDLRSFLDASPELDTSYRPFYNDKLYKADLIDRIVSLCKDNDLNLRYIIRKLDNELGFEFMKKITNDEMINVLSEYSKRELAEKLVSLYNGDESDDESESESDYEVFNDFGRDNYYEPQHYEPPSSRILTESEWQRVQLNAIRVGLNELNIDTLEYIVDNELIN
jgi:hypothetical protein